MPFARLAPLVFLSEMPEFTESAAEAAALEFADRDSRAAIDRPQEPFDFDYGPIAREDSRRSPCRVS